MKMTGKIRIKFASGDYHSQLSVIHKIDEKTGFKFMHGDDPDCWEFERDHPITAGVWEIREVIYEAGMQSGTLDPHDPVLATITVSTDYVI
jgi:hypothetical protein